LPRLQPLYEKYRDRGFNIIAVDARADTERARTFIADKGLTFTFLEDTDEADVVGGAFGGHGFPTSLLIDREGRVMYYHMGFEPGAEDGIAEELETLL